jgi:hypothetical protein
MPYKSQAQSRYIHGVASGSIPQKKGGMSKQAAQKFVSDSHGQSVSKLPQRIAGAVRSGSPAKSIKY